MTPAIPVLLVDDHALFRESVSKVLGSEPDFTVRQCATIGEAMQQLEQSPAEVVLLDHDLGNERASQFLPAAQAQGYKPKVLVVTAWVSDTEARRLIRQGVSGIFLKESPLEQLLEAIRTVARGEAWFDRNYRRLENESQEAETQPGLNERQRKVLRYILEGLSNKEIAWRLQISESYVKAILQSLFDRMGVRTRGQLVRIALEQFQQQL